ncbi:MAG: circadian clock protein KaiC [Ilumatobacteraceae bacterium]
MAITGAISARTALLGKTPTGIRGLDEVTGGGLPTGRPTLVCGPAGCGKTLLAMEFLVRGIIEFDEPGVFVAFEETIEDLRSNVVSLGFDLAQLEADGQLILDHVTLIRGDLEETGEWDLEGLFLRLGGAIDAVGAKRVVIDTVETLFSAFSNTRILRSELARLCAFLKERGVTAVITAERGDGSLTRNGIEEYVSDCVIVLDHRVTEQTSVRRLRILKYRGSHHGTNEYPFVIGETGISVLPMTSLGLRHSVSKERVSTGTSGLDSVLGNAGFFKGSSVHVSGTSGTGKTTLAAQFCNAACQRGERAMFFSFDESRDEIFRNMLSVGIDLRQWIDAGLMQLHCFRPSLLGLEAHLLTVQQLVGAFNPSIVVKDPISDLISLGSAVEVAALLARQVDFLKARGVTSLFTSLTSAREPTRVEQQMTSLADIWLLIKSVEDRGSHNRYLYVVKARGVANSNQTRALLLTDQGMELADVFDQSDPLHDRMRDS